MKTIAVGVACLLLAACTEEKNLGNTYTLRSARWATSIPVVSGYGFVSASFVALDPTSADVFAAGGFEGTVDFGGGALTTDDQQPTYWITKRSGANGGHVWTRILGTDPNFELMGLRVDSSGNAIVAGSFSGTQPFGDQPVTASQGNIYVAKLSPDGHTMWVRGLDLASETSAQVYSLAVGPDGRIYVSGMFHGAILFPTLSITSSPQSDCFIGGSSCFVAAFEPDGTLRWGRQIPVLAALDVASDGSVIMAAAAQRSMTFAGHSIDLSSDPAQFAARITADGDVSWVRGFGPAGVPYYHVRLALDDQDRIATSSYINTSPIPTPNQAFLDASGNQLWTAAPASGKVMERAIATNGHAVLTAGSFADWSVDLGNGPQIGAMYIAARNADGSLADANVYGDPSVGGDGFTSLAMTSDGAVAFTADVGESIDFGNGLVPGPVVAGQTNAAIVIGLFAPEM